MKKLNKNPSNLFIKLFGDMRIFEYVYQINPCDQYNIFPLYKHINIKMKWKLYTLEKMISVIKSYYTAFSDMKMDIPKGVE